MRGANFFDESDHPREEGFMGRPRVVARDARGGRDVSTDIQESVDSGGDGGGEDGGSEDAKRLRPANWEEMTKSQREHWKQRNLRGEVAGNHRLVRAKGIKKQTSFDLFVCLS